VAVLLPTVAFAAPSVSITNLGTPSDTSPGHSGAGWTAYLVTVNADPGDVVGEIDMGDPGQGNTSLTNGLFGSFLQNWVPAASKKSQPTPTPIEPDMSGGGYGLDSHILYPLANMVALPAPYEDNSGTLASPTPTNPTSDSGDLFGTGTSIHGIFGLTNQTPSVQLAYLVLPTAGTAKAGSYTLTISEAPAAGGLATIFNGITGSIGGGGGTTVTPPGTHNIVNLTSATQTGGNYGVQLTAGTGANQATFAPNAPVAGNINVTKGGPSSYTPGFANAVSGATAGTGAITDFTAISGFAAGDQEIYALKLLVGGSTPTSTQISTIVTDIGGQSGDGVSTVANLLSTSGNSLATQIATLFPGYDLLLSVTTGTATPFLGFDFTQETNVAGVVVTNIAAVPEPASAAILLIGSSLLMGRRKRNALMA
jgi:hypothetical protein